MAGGSKKDPNEELKMLAEQRRERVASLYLKGVTQANIARMEKVSQKTISLDLKRIRQDWAKNAARDVGERTLEEIARIDRIELECWEAWERSKEVARSESEEVEESLRAQKDEDGERTGESALVPVSRKLKVSSKGQTGDERYLARIAWCVETRLRLSDAFPREKKPSLIEAGDGSRVTVFIEDLHAPGTRTSREMEERLERERERLGGPTVVDQAPPPPPEPPRNGHH